MSDSRTCSCCCGQKKTSQSAGEIEVNRSLVAMEYAVRGPIPQRAAQLKSQGRTVISCNIGNPQSLGQKPLDYYRYVLSLVECPSLIEREKTLGKQAMDPQIISTAELILSNLTGGMGAYTDSKGPAFIRQAVAKYIDRRDGVNCVASNPEQVFLTNGASDGAKNVLDLLISKRTDGIMIPIPQYPLYSATITKCCGTIVPYFPDEEKGWLLNRKILESSLQKARAEGVTVKAIVVINPGNPTGSILDRASIEDVIAFAQEHSLAIIADEVYQENTYGIPFVSFAAVMGDRPVPLFSLHSVSKGFYGECGHRGGYLEVRNPPKVAGSDLSIMDILVKQASVSLCSNTVGQAMVYLMVTPPAEGTQLAATFAAQKKAILDELWAKAEIIKQAFTKMKGVECFGRFGAMYLFPRLTLPEGKTDFDYCMALLEETGLCTVNGSGFGMTNHMRIAVLPPRDMLSDVLPKWIEFHNKYVG